MNQKYQFEMKSELNKLKTGRLKWSYLIDIHFKSIIVESVGKNIQGKQYTNF